MIRQEAYYIPGTIEGSRRVVVRDVAPQIDAGTYPIKRVVGDTVSVSAAVFSDSHDAVGCHVLYRHDDDKRWSASRLNDVGNDIWKGSFSVTSVGRYIYTVQGWVDRFDSWYRDTEARIAAGQELVLPLLTGALIVEEAVLRAQGGDAEVLSRFASSMREVARQSEIRNYVCSDVLIELMKQYPDLRFATTYERLLEVSVDRIRARYSTWYEMFPRSAAGVKGVHGTLRDCEKRIPLVADMGFDVLYLPPIHPIGKAFRKGRNNNTVAETEDVGSPWAIGSELGGHKAIHPQLGSTVDFLSLVRAAKDHAMEIALDIAFQCSPDHPYVKEHPEWFLKRPDGTIQYAENPPKKYQDIYPLNFSTAAWWELWNELKSVFIYWIELGVRIFRVDNPHTKAFPFWRWAISSIKADYPDVLFLAEAFTRPHPMYELAKLGFSQSYTYFTWRNTKEELTAYLEELNSEAVCEFFRPNFWPNTPDILPYGLQRAEQSNFAARFILASTLCANYGIYGSAYELCENMPKEAGSEEYLDSEKYELKVWNADPNAGLRPLIRTINSIRNKNQAFQVNDTIRFHESDNKSLIAYSKRSLDGTNVVLVIVNIESQVPQQGSIDLGSLAGGAANDNKVLLRDLLSGEEYALDNPHQELNFHPDTGCARVYQVISIT